MDIVDRTTEALQHDGRMADMKTVDKNHPKLQQRPMSNSALGFTMHQYGLRPDGSSSGEKVMVVLVGNRLGVSQRCVHAVTMANHRLGCTTTRVASRSSEVRPQFE